MKVIIKKPKWNEWLLDYFARNKDGTRREIAQWIYIHKKGELPDRYKFSSPRFKERMLSTDESISIIFDYLSTPLIRFQKQNKIKKKMLIIKKRILNNGCLYEWGVVYNRGIFKKIFVLHIASFERLTH